MGTLEASADSLLQQQQSSAGGVREQQLRRRWFNGRMYASHAYDPGSTPGRRILFFFPLSPLLSPSHRFLETGCCVFFFALSLQLRSERLLLASYCVLLWIREKTEMRLLVCSLLAGRSCCFHLNQTATDARCLQLPW